MVIIIYLLALVLLRLTLPTIPSFEGCPNGMPPPKPPPPPPLLLLAPNEKLLEACKGGAAIPVIFPVPLLPKAPFPVEEGGMEPNPPAAGATVVDRVDVEPKPPKPPLTGGGIVVEEDELHAPREALHHGGGSNIELVVTPSQPRGNGQELMFVPGPVRMRYDIIIISYLFHPFVMIILL